jgi:predicted  nucleic acid-binding Zn ribbon protein
MILACIKFGGHPGKRKGQLETIAVSYLAGLRHAGQICGEYFLTWIGKKLHAHVLLECPTALEARYHSESGRQTLAQVKEAFGQKPHLTLMDDDARTRVASWRTAPFLYLFTNPIDWDSPVRRGDNGKPIPACLLPVSSQLKESLNFWKVSYCRRLEIIPESGLLEFAAYRQLAEPNSDLSRKGRRLCQAIEEATGVPTFYYLIRFYERRQGEKRRRCPGCGGAWSVRWPDPEQRQFWQFEFRCNRCRLVSVDGILAGDERQTKIGEFRATKSKRGGGTRKPPQRKRLAGRAK